MASERSQQLNNLHRDHEQWMSDAYFSLFGSHEQRWGLIKGGKKDTFDLLTDITNRSKSQTLFLYELCDRSCLKLLLLEKRLKEKFTTYCPADKETIEEILKS